MNCTEFEARLNELLDERRRLAGDRLLAAHAAQCTECAELAAEYSMLASAAAKMAQGARVPEKALRPEFTLQVLSSLEPRQVRGRWSSKMLRGGAIALAAAAAVLMAVMNWPRPEAGGGPSSGPTNVASASNESIFMAVQWDLVVLDAAAQRMGWMGEVAEGFRPVTQSFYSALNALRRALPGHAVPAHTSIEDSRSSLISREMDLLV